MNLIIKHNGKAQNLSPFYTMEEDPRKCRLVGIMQNEAIDVLLLASNTREVPHTEIIEKYFNHAGFIAFCSHCRYFEITNKN